MGTGVTLFLCNLAWGWVPSLMQVADPAHRVISLMRKRPLRFLVFSMCAVVGHRAKFILLVFLGNKKNFS